MIQAIHIHHSVKTPSLVLKNDVCIKFLLCLITTVILLMGTALPSWSQQADEDDTLTYLKTLPLEALLNMTVTSVSKKAQNLTDAPAAVFVVTGDAIRRSGVRSIPEALRMVPGLQVAKVSTNSWMITARGFGDFFSNKLLVLIDGRSVYTPLYSGVFWDVQDTLMEDIDRIEVIRGPGAALWGANAVNGIINVITKKAKETQGGFLEAGVGTEERGFGSIRYGGEIDANTHYRIYGTYFDRDPGESLPGFTANDDWQTGRGGFRLDWQATFEDEVTVQGDAYHGEEGITRNFPSLNAPPLYETHIQDDATISGGNLLSRWEHMFSPSSKATLQFYYDRTERDDPIFKGTRDTVDLDLQHGFQFGSHEFLWGLGWHVTADDLTPKRYISFDSTSESIYLFSAFIQDEMELVNNRLWLTIGSKFEYYELSGFEIQPSLRLLLKPHERHTIWGAISRAVRTPSRGEDEFELDIIEPPSSAMVPPIVIRVVGNDELDSEELIAFEVGYRFQATRRLFFDLAVFYNDYDNLVGQTVGMPQLQLTPAPHLLVPSLAVNNETAETWGAELAISWQPSHWLDVNTGYTYFEANADKDLIESGTPKHQFTLRSSVDLPHNVEWDCWLRYVDDISILNTDGYVTMDVQLSWKPVEKLELSIVGQNLLDNNHLEYRPSIFPALPTEIERSVYGKISCYF